ncbi:MAG: IS982 family transposase [Treponema sp.]|jgi:hypothetical protein|nr:IS982 family transposase [Treponema sp.]
MNELSIITLYCFVDEFIKSITGLPVGTFILNHWQGKRGPQKRLTLAEVMTLNLLRFYLRVHDLKTFHRLAWHSYRDYFPGLPNYENFLKAANRSFPAIVVFMKYMLFLTRMREGAGTYFIDSTALSVCENPYISSHRVTRGYASRGKTSKGWFFGFKAHGVCTKEGGLMDVLFTTGSVHDSQVVPEITKDLEGLFVGDAGYLLREEIFRELYERHRHIMSAARKNMKRVMNGEQKQLFRDRSCIETIWDVLKERFQLVYRLARGMTGLFRHYSYSITSFLLRSFIESSVPLLKMPLKA